MPFKSGSQMGWMFANRPQMAKGWAGETPNIKGLADHVSKVLKGKMGGYGKTGNNFSSPDLEGETDGKLGPTQEA